MKSCPKCNRLFPESLLSEMAIGQAGKLHYELLCPICGLARSNELSGLRRKNFSDGSVAQAMLEEARRLYPAAS